MTNNSESKPLINQLMSSNIITITPDQTLYKAAKIMGENHIGSLVVMMYDTAVGMITERDLLNTVSQGVDLEKDWIGGGESIRDQNVNSVMSYPVVKICSFATLKKASRIMIEKKIRRLLVCDMEKMVGILTASDMIGNLPEVKENMEAWFEVDYFMTKNVITADEKTLVDQIAIMMAKNHIGSVVITKNNEPLGIFTERDLLTKFLAKNRTLITEVGDICSSPLIAASFGTSINDAASIMTSNNIRRLPITKNNKLVGILSARDLVEAYARK